MAVWTSVIAVITVISFVTSEDDILTSKILSRHITTRLNRRTTPKESLDDSSSRAEFKTTWEGTKEENGNYIKQLLENEKEAVKKKLGENKITDDATTNYRYNEDDKKQILEINPTTEILQKLQNISIKYVTLSSELSQNNEEIFKKMEGLFPIKRQTNITQYQKLKQNRPLESLDQLFPEKLTRNLTTKNNSEFFSDTPEQLARKLDMSTEYFLVPEKTTQKTSTTKITEKSTTTKLPDIEKRSLFREEVWVVPVVTLAAVSMFLMAGFEIFVLCKAWRTTPSRRHLFLGQMLLLGLFACASLSGVLALSPTPSTCATVRFGIGLAYAIVFASLLVKCVFLISLNGGVYLPAPYQGLLLLFAVLIQVAIGAQWLLTDPPQIDVLHESHTTDVQLTRSKNPTVLVTRRTGSANVTLCRTPYMDMLFSLCYVLFLIVFVAVLAVKSRGIRDNYREATYIGLSVGCTIPIWLVWTLSGMLVADRHRDACLAFGLVVTAAVVFLVMFMPKGRQLAAMGKDGVFLEDREDRFSSLSRTGSGYSPSFFHFKPAGKYGSKHHQVGPTATVTTLGPGKIFFCFNVCLYNNTSKYFFIMYL